MPRKAGKRVQLKRLRFEVKQALALNQDRFPFLLKLKELEARNNSENPQEVSLCELTPIGIN